MNGEILLAKSLNIPIIPKTKETKHALKLFIREKFGEL